MPTAILFAKKLITQITGRGQQSIYRECEKEYILRVNQFVFMTKSPDTSPPSQPDCLKKLLEVKNEGDPPDGFSEHFSPLQPNQEDEKKRPE